jgi:outer membrane receptor protein involved in Fe transport
MGIHDGYTHGLGGRSARAFAVVSKRLEVRGHRLELLGGATATRFMIESNYTGYLQNGDLGDFRRQSHDAAEGFASGWWEHRLRLLRRPLRLRAGLEWRGDWFTQDEAMIEIPSRQVWRKDREASGQLHRITLAAGGRWVLWPWLQVELGLRGDLFIIDFEDQLVEGRRYQDLLYAISPRSMLRFPVARDWTLFAAYGRGFRSPEARAVALGDRPGEDVTLDLYQGGEPEVTVSDEVEVGLQLDRGDRFVVSLAGFATFIDNEMVFDHVSGTNLELNATRRLGADLGARVRPRSWMELRVDLTGVDARFVESGNPVPGAPRFLTSFGLTVSHPSGFSGSLTGFYMAPRPLAHGATGTHQLLLNLAVCYRWRFIEVRLELDNLLDWDWHEGEYHFASWFDRTEQRSMIPVTHVTAGTPFNLRAGVTLWL